MKLRYHRTKDGGSPRNVHVFIAEDGESGGFVDDFDIKIGYGYHNIKEMIEKYDPYVMHKLKELRDKALERYGEDADFPTEEEMFELMKEHK